MRRRLVLGSLLALLVLLLAGCAHPAGSMRMEQVNDSGMADRASQAAEDADGYPAIHRQRLARQVVENGTLDVTAGRQPLGGDLPYRYRGQYYDLSADVVDTVAGSSALVSVDYDPPDPEGTRVAFADLPRIDRERLGPVLANPPARLRDGPDAELPLFYTQSESTDSTLLTHAGGSLLVSYGGDIVNVAVSRLKDEPLQVYRYEATLVAGSTGGYVTHLKDVYAFELSGLSDAEASVVEDATDDAYYADGTDDEGFAALVERFRARKAVERDEYGGSWLVRYDGAFYWVEMDFGAFAGDGTVTTRTPAVTPH